MSQKGILIGTITAMVMVGVVVYVTFWLLDQSIPEPGSAQAGRATAVAPDPGPTSADTAPGNELIDVDVDGSAETAGGSDDGAASATPAPAGRIEVTLYVLARSGRTLTTESREIPLASSLQAQAKEVVSTLLQRSAAMPRGVELRELFITSQGVAYVDLSRELVSNHPGGSSAEELTVYSLSTTLITNFPAIQLVQILVEGREVQTIAGHLDLSVPYQRAPDYLLPEEAARRPDA